SQFFVIGSLANNTLTNNLFWCEISHMHLAPASGVSFASGYAIEMHHGTCAHGVRISDIFMTNIYSGIGCTIDASGNPLTQEYVNNVSIDNVQMETVTSCGIYARFAV